MAAEGKKGYDRLLSGLAVLVIATMLLAVYLQFNALRATKAKLAAEEAMVIEGRLRLENIRGLEAQEKVLKRQIDILEQYLPASAREEQLLVDMQSAADLSGLRFALIRFGERVNKDGYRALPFDMTFEGRYHGMLNLLDYLKAYERAVRIEDVKIELSRASPPDLVVYIKASVFYYGE